MYVDLIYSWSLIALNMNTCAFSIQEMTLLTTNHNNKAMAFNRCTACKVNLF